MRIEATALDVQSIDHDEIRLAGEKYTAAKQALSEQQKALVDLEREGRDEAKQRDAVEDEAARSAGKPRPKQRRHVAEFEKKLDAAEHEVLVGQLAVERALKDFQAVVDEHGAAWVERLDREVETRERAWSAAVVALERLHSERVAAHQRRRVTGGEVSPIAAISLRPNLIHGVEVNYSGTSPQQRHRMRATVVVEDVLAALRSLGVPEEIEPMAANAMAEDFKRATEHARAVKQAHEGRYDRQSVRPMPQPAGLHIDGTPVIAADPDDRAELLHHGV